MKWRHVLVLAVAVLAISAQPVAAQNASAVASEHATFGTGGTGEPAPTTLDNMEIAGSGPSASLAAGTTAAYNPAYDDGEGSPGDPVLFVGDDGVDRTLSAEIRIQPESDGQIESISPYIATAVGSDYGARVDIYIVAEQPDGTYGEGQLVRSDWNPDWSTGRQQIDISVFDVTAGQDYTIEFITDSTDNDAKRDALEIRADFGSSSQWYSLNNFARTKYYADLDVEINQSLTGAQYIGATHNAEAVTSGWTNLTLQNADATVTWQEDADNDGTWTNVTSTTYSTSGNVTADLSATTSDRWRVRIDFDKTGSNAVAELHDEGVLFPSSSPTLSDAEPPDQAKIENAVGNVSINVSDADFPLTQGDNVTVSASDDDGNSLGSTTLTSNGTASLAYTSEAGANVIQWTATDAYGNSDTFTQRFETPSRLTLYNETAPSQKLQTNANITATFFGAGGETVVQRTSPDATFNFSGLPAGTEYIVTVDAKGYRERSLVINSLYDQQSFYLLPNSADASQIVFELSDPTGEFPPGDTRLYIEKPIRVNNSTTYKTVSADTFGATAAYSVILADGVRYRLRIRHDGQERILGSYTPTVATTEVLRVQRIEPSAEDVPQDAVYGSVEDGQLAVRFRGGDNDTSVEYRVTNSSGAVVVPKTETTGASFAHVYPVPNNTTDSYNVSYEVVDGGETVRDGSFTTGDVAGIAGRFNMDGQLLSLLSWFAIMATLGLVVIVDTRLAPAAGTGMASALTILGTVAIPAPLLGVSGVVAVLALFGRPS